MYTGGPISPNRIVSRRLIETQGIDPNQQKNYTRKNDSDTNIGKEAIAQGCCSGLDAAKPFPKE